MQDIAIDGRVLLFTIVIALAAAALFGLVPALQASRADLQSALKEGGRDSRVGTGWLRRVLVVSEIAASVVLVAAAILLARSFTELLDVRQVQPGARAHAAHLAARPAVPDGASMARAYRDIAQRLREMPGVEAAGAVTGLPLASTRGDWGIRIEGRPPQERQHLAADWQVVTPGYFEALGMPLEAGRLFTDADREDTLPVIVINETMARTYWPGTNPLGRRLTMGGNTNWLTIVGIVGDIRHRGLDAQPRTEMYRPHTQFRFGTGSDAKGVPTMTWAIRTAGDPLATTSFASAAVRRVDPGLGVSDVATMEQVVADSTSDRRLNMLLFALLGGLALVLAAVGVYGVVAYSVTQRTHEIGVRMAIGARPLDVRRMVLMQGCRLAAAGVAIGLVLALAAARVMRGLLFHVSPNDPATFASVAAALLAVAALASYIPARRATRVDPMIALRGE